MTAGRFFNQHAPGATPWPPDSFYDPCSTGHSDDRYRDDRGHWCCRRCGTQVLREAGRW